MKISLTPCLKQPELRLWMLAQFASLVGRWIECMGVLWLVYRLTNQTSSLGVVTLLVQGPALVLASYAGWLVDKVDCRRILLVTQSTFILLALALVTMTVLHWVSVPLLMGAALLHGCAFPIDMVARRLYLRRVLADPSLLPSALGVHSFSTSGSKLLGPALAALLMTKLGPLACFAAGFLCYVPALVASRLLPVRAATLPAQSSGLLTAVRYVRGHPVISHAMGLSALANFLLMPYTALFVAYVAQAFRAGESLAGTLVSTGAVGGLLAAFLLGPLSRKWAPLPRAVATYAIMALCVAGVSISAHIWISAALVFIAGLAMQIGLVSLSVVIQTEPAPDLRGKVSGLSLSIDIGMTSLGSLTLAEFAQATQVKTAFATSALLFLAFLTVGCLRHLRTSYRGTTSVPQEPEAA